MRWLVCLVLVGVCAACGAETGPPADAYGETVPACAILPEETVATVTDHLPPARPVAVDPDTDRSSSCRRDFADPKFTVWVSLRVLRLVARGGVTGADRARLWLRSYGTDIADAAPPISTDREPPPAPSARTAKDLGFDAVSLGPVGGAADLYAVDGNVAVVVEYGHTPTVAATKDDIPRDEGWRMREATFRLAKDVARGLHRYRTG